jgi:hypothetical protein
MKLFSGKKIGFFSSEISDTVPWVMFCQQDVAQQVVGLSWRRGLAASSPPATEEIGLMGREVESRQGM